MHFPPAFRLHRPAVRLLLARLLNTAHTQLPPTTAQTTQHAKIAAARQRSRLASLNSMLKNNSLFTQTGRACHALYAETGANLVKDLVRHPDEGLLLDLFRGFHGNSTVRSLILESLFRLAADHHTIFFDAVKLLQNHVVFGTMERDLLRQLGDGKNVNAKFSFACSLAVQVGEPLVAALFALQTADAGFEVEPLLLSRMVLALSVPHPVMDTYNAYAIFALLQHFPETLSPETLRRVVHNLCSSSGDPFFANVLYDRLPKMHADLTEAALIVSNIRQGNIFRARDLWLACASTEFASQNIHLLYQLLKASFDRNLVRVLLDSVPDLSTNPEILDFALHFYGAVVPNADKFNAFSHRLALPLQRRTLTLLFCGMLELHRPEAASKILQTIFQTADGLNATDFDVIIQGLLREGKVSACLDMCTSTHVRVTYKGAMRLLEYLHLHQRAVDEALQGQRAKFLAAFVKSLNNNTLDESVYHHITVCVFRFLSLHVNNRASRKVFLTYSYLAPGARPQKYLFYGLPHGLQKFLRVQGATKIECLWIIMRQATVENDKHVLQWGRDELKHAGIPTADHKHFVE